MGEGSIFVAAPDLTPAAWAAELGGTRIAREADVGELYAIVLAARHPDGRDLSHRFMLALAKSEHQYGDDPTSVEAAYGTRSWGMRRTLADPDIAAASSVETPKGRFVRYRRWEDSLYDCCYALTAPGFVYQREGRETVAAVCARWSPAADGNAPAEKVAAIDAVMARLAGGEGEGVATPTIVEKLTPINHWRGRDGHRVEAIVLHVAEGLRDGVLAWFNDPASEASAHYLVNKDGSIWRFVGEEDTAWANGVVKRPNRADPLIDSWVAAGINPNRRTISIETEGWHYEDLTPPQLASVAWLAADITRRRGLPADGTRLLGHNEIDSVTRARCPSLSREEWAAIVAGLAAPAPAPAERAPSVRSYVDPATGEPVTEVRWGGRAKRVLGTNFVDLGISVEGVPSGTWDRTLRANRFEPWRER